MKKVLALVLAVIMVCTMAMAVTIGGTVVVSPSTTPTAYSPPYASSNASPATLCSYTLFRFCLCTWSIKRNPTFAYIFQFFKG